MGVAGAQPQSLLFCREKNLERETWDGFRYGPEAAREAFGVDAAYPVAVLECATETPAGMPVGPPLFRFSDERELAGLLEGAGLAEVSVQPVSFVERFDGPDEVWEGILASTVRTRALLVAQDEATQARIRACFERLCAEHRCDGGIELPVEMLVASGRRP